jgi:biofilm PGA synthesis N-glycosyltransferase PgaC
MSIARYAVVTAAKNEAAFIERTFQMVLRQTVMPQKWGIVSDGLTDRTNEIVNRYADQFKFIELISRERGEHQFGSKVKVVNAVVEHLGGSEYEYLGVLDADIQLLTDYYEVLLGHFRVVSEIGILGGTRKDLHGEVFVPIRFNELSIGGTYQCFRRSCCEDIGGYLCLEFGGTDMMAGVAARQRGWKVRALAELEALHLIPAGLAEGNCLRRGISRGKTNCMMGYHHVFEILKLLRVRSGNNVLHNVGEVFGFVSQWFSREEYGVPHEVVAFLRQELFGRLRHFMTRFRDPASGRIETTSQMNASAGASP